VLASVPGEPPRLALRVGGFCVVGIDTRARYGGELWYAAPLEGARWR
jgi:hypothetical protein